MAFGTAPPLNPVPQRAATLPTRLNSLRHSTQPQPPVQQHGTDAFETLWACHISKIVSFQPVFDLNTKATSSTLGGLSSPVGTLPWAVSYSEKTLASGKQPSWW
jgi:hypothetical protein